MPEIENAIFVPIPGGFKQKLVLSDILYIEAAGAYSNLYYETNEKTRENTARESSKNSFYKISLSSNNLVAQLAYAPILRVHRSFYVNTNKIDKISTYSLFIRGTEIPIGPEYNNETLKKTIRSLKHNNH